MTASFKFGNSISGVNDFWARTSALPVDGALILMNGVDPNRAVYDVSLGMTDLVPRAPRDEIVPLVDAFPSVGGKVFGDGLKWRMRYYDSKRNVYTGMSPIPEIGLNLGVEESLTGSSADWMGVRAYFQLPGTDIIGMNRIQLLRNTTDQDNVWYVAVEVDNPGEGNFADVTDNMDQDTLLGQETANLTPNMGYFDGVVPPLAKSFTHPTKRTAYYGIIPQGPYRAGTVAITADSPTITGTGTRWKRAREGQVLIVTAGDDVKRHRIIEVVSETELAVSPYPDSTVSGLTYEIIDDRDAGQFWLSEPNQPFHVNAENGLSVGGATDALHHMCAFGNTTFALTRERILAFENDVSEDPRLTLRITEVAQEGSAGLWAQCVTPIGLVYLHPKLGVRVFDGSAPKALGAQTLADAFGPLTQLQNISEPLLSQSYMYYDHRRHQIVLTYVPSGLAAPSEQLVFDLETFTWRGPWQRRIFAAGDLIGHDGVKELILGDDLAVLCEDGVGSADMTLAADGTIPDDDLVFDGPHQVLDLSDLSVTNATALGSPILFVYSDGTHELNWISYVISAGVVALLYIPTQTNLDGLTWYIGYIDWQLTTGFLDGGEPAQRKELDRVRLRFMPADVTAFAVEVDADGEDDFQAASATYPSTGTAVYQKAKLDKGGHAFQLRLKGIATPDVPKITAVVADMDINEGAS